MLRKRTAFKPNLKQVTPLASQPPAPTNAGPTPADAVVESAANTNPAAKDQSNNLVGQQNPSNLHNINNPTTHSSEPDATLSATETSNCYTNINSRDCISNISSQRVQEAITQLTGQKLEPIKSLSLRSSANKNVKLKDLLFFNPPMTKDQRRHKKSVFLAKKNELKKVKEGDDMGNSGDRDTIDSQPTMAPPPTIDDEHSLVPQVKMGPEGNLILDESSTIINRKNSIKEQEAIVEDNEDIISRTNYDSFRRRPSNTSQTKWSPEDTQKFYQALTILGTDFSMMESLLFCGQRSRTELHKKFKREERVNKLKIDIALSNRISLSSEELDDLRETFYK